MPSRKSRLSFPRRSSYCDVLVNTPARSVWRRARAAAASRWPDRCQLRAVVSLTCVFAGHVARRRAGSHPVRSRYSPGPYMAAYCASGVRPSWSPRVANGRQRCPVTCLTPGVVRTAFFNRQASPPTACSSLAAWQRDPRRQRMVGASRPASRLLSRSSTRFSICCAVFCRTGSCLDVPPCSDEDSRQLIQP